MMNLESRIWNRRFTLADLFLWLTLAGLIAAVLMPMFRGGPGSSLVQRLAVSADGSTAAALFTDGMVRVWKTADGTLTSVLKTPVDDGVGFAISADGTTIARFCSLPTAPSSAIELWDVRTTRHVRSLPASPGCALAFAPEGGRLAWTAQSGNVEFYEPPLGDSPAVLLASPPAASMAGVWFAPVFSPDGRLLAVRNAQGEVVVFDVATRKRQATLDTGSRAGEPIAFSPDARKLLAISGTSSCEFEAPAKTATAWDFSSAERRSPKTDDLSSAICAAYLADGHTIAVASFGRVMFVDTKTGLTKEVESRAFSAVASDRGDVLITSDFYGVDLWDAAQATVRRKLWTSAPGVNGTVLVAVFVAWLLVYNVRKVRKRLRLCHTCGRRFAPASKHDRSVDCENCRRQAHLKTLTPRQSSREPYKQSLRRFGKLIPLAGLFLLLVWLGGGLSKHAWLLVIPAVIPAWIGLMLLKSHLKRRRTINERNDLRLADESAAACGEIRHVAGMTVWSAGPSTLPDILPAQMEICRQRLQEVLGQNVPPPDDGRVLVFTDRRGLARYFASLRLPLASGPRSNGVYLVTPLKKIVVAERELFEQTADPLTRLRVLIFYRLLESCDPVFQQSWLASGLGSALARDDGDDELVRFHRRTKAALQAGRAIEPAEFFQRRPAKTIRRVSRRGDHALHAWILQYQTQAWSLVEFLCGRGSTPERRTAFRQFWSDPFRRRRKAGECLSDHYHASLDDLFQQWRNCVEAQPLGEHQPPPPQLAAWMRREPMTAVADGTALRRDRILAIRHLGELGFAFGADRLIDVLRGDDLFLREEAIWALECISGEVRGTSPDAWEAWWRTVPEAARTAPERAPVAPLAGG